MNEEGKRADVRHRRSVRWHFFMMLAAACFMRCSPARGQSSTLQEQIKQHEQKLAGARAAKSQKDEAVQLLSLGLLYSTAGEKQRALEVDNQASAISRELKSRPFEALNLNNIGLVYDDLGQKQKGLLNEVAALSLAKAVEDPDLQGRIDTSLMMHFRDQKRPEVAIFFGMDAVNSFQQIRRNISGLDKDVQAGFAKSKFGNVSATGGVAGAERPSGRSRTSPRSPQRRGTEGSGCAARPVMPQPKASH
jgi:tetratricopeptide (TPR) repeat protein